MAGEGSKQTQFKPGQSGNPKGRPPGSRARTLAALDRLGDDSAETILITMIDEAKGGDISAARAVLNRVDTSPTIDGWAHTSPQRDKALPQAIFFPFSHGEQCRVVC